MRAPRLLNLCLATILGLGISARVSAQSSSSSKQSKRSSTTGTAAVDSGVVSIGVYRNKALGMTCKIPAGWVLRTEEMNSQESANEEKPAPQGAPRNTGDQHVLLAAFSRPPEARGEDINSSIVIAAESVAAYPGLQEAAQYFGPVTEVAKAQGFAVDEEPYEFALGAKNLVRGDFQKDVGTRVMHQSTLVFLSHGYVVSMTVIGGTDDEVEQLIDAISLSGK